MTLMNNLGFNLCVVSQSPAVKWSHILEGKEVVEEGVLKK